MAAWVEFFGLLGKRSVTGALCLAAAAGFVAAAHAAETGPWHLAAVDGEVTLDGRAVTVPGVALATGAVLRTGGDGTAVLTRPGDSITLFANSSMAIPAEGASAEPGILQTLGRLLFRMESRESRDFEVHTPYLAAAVKGTTFTVEVAAGNADVSVEEGSVLVVANRSGFAAYVGAGQRASVGEGREDSVTVSAARRARREAGEREQDEKDDDGDGRNDREESDESASYGDESAGDDSKSDDGESYSGTYEGSYRSD